MVICIVTATISSLVSASFANRVSNRTVGLVSGVVLTVLGGTMIFLNYREFFLTDPLAADTAVTFLKYLIYILSFAALLIILRTIFPVPKNIFRKLLHIAAFTSSIFIVFMGKNWLADTITLVLFAFLVYPVLLILEKWKGFSSLFVEKSPGEVRNSLLLLFLSQAALLAFSCGLLHKPYILVVSTAAWGLGDIAAAWVGRPFGKHKIKLKPADHNKSWEGSGAMSAVAFIASLIPLLLMSPYNVFQSVIISVIIAAVSSFTEMVSRGGMDTITVPLADAAVLWLISLLAV